MTDLWKLFGRLEVGSPEGCWLWTGALADGYGSTRQGKPHRLIYEILVGPIPSDLVLDHVCHNKHPSCPGGATCSHRRCCNPDHLRLCTRRENVQAGHRWISPPTHCPRQHAYTPTNTRIDKGSRVCRTCDRERKRKP